MVAQPIPLQLAVDIGNTNITVGVYDGEKLKHTWRIVSAPARTSDEYRLALQHLMTEAHVGVEQRTASIICSVVPKLTDSVCVALEQLTGTAPRIVGRDVIVPVANEYADPTQVGQDRLVNAYSGAIRYGGPLIIIDFGTAITLDVVTKDRRYLGGVIAPGIEISLEALAQRTALLPRVQLAPQSHVLGRTTTESIRSGLLHGCGALCDGLIQKLRAETQLHATVVATGGYAEMISTYCQYIDCINIELTLDGLYLLDKSYRDGTLDAWHREHKTP